MWSKCQILFLLVFFLVSASGCSLKGFDFGDLPESPTAKQDVWQPIPVAIRIYPSTRFIRRDKTQILEARVELFDEMGDSIKGAGIYAFELLEAIGPTGGGAGAQLYTWNADLMNLDAQRQHYDPISRGYVFQLKMHENKIAKQGAMLRVVYSPPQGKRLINIAQILP